jgi:hypothetical protein
MLNMLFRLVNYRTHSKHYFQTEFNKNFQDLHLYNQSLYNMQYYNYVSIDKKNGVQDEFTATISTPGRLHKNCWVAYS